MQELPTAFSPGQDIVVRNERWTVLHAQRFDGVCVLDVRGTGRDNRDELQAFVAPYDEIVAARASTRLRRRRRRAALATAARQLAAAAPWDECWVASTAHLDLRAWQLEPARAAVTGTMRLLLADGVGLGKTIQAGLVIAELFARGLARRALVLTPASIRLQWADELEQRFGLSPTVFDHATIESLTSSLPAEANPWQSAALTIASVDLVKRPEVRAAVDGVPFDILVVDEAHHLIAGSERFAAVSALAARTPWVVLATATPHAGDDRAYAELCGVGDVAGEPMRIFRRVSTGPTGQRERRVRNLAVSPTPAERALLDAANRYVHLIAKRGCGDGARLVASVIARRAASSALAARQTLGRRLALLDGTARSESQPVLPWDEDPGDELSDTLLAAPGLSNRAAELEWLRSLVTLAEAAAGDGSKVRVLDTLIRRSREPVVVFSEYRDVVMQIAVALRGQRRVATLYGGMSPPARAAVVAAFNCGDADVLIATDAAGEGLNLHHRCRLVVNIELPWMPRRLEQRVGRVDRIGQQRRVHAIQLVHRDSFEATVIARLDRRRARLQALTQQPARDDVDVLASTQRHLLALASGVATVDVAPARRGFSLADHAAYSVSRVRSTHTLLAFSASLHDDAGARIASHLVVLNVSHERARLSRARVRELCTHHSVRDAVDAACAAWLSAAEPVLAATSAAMSRRLQAVLHHTAAFGRHVEWQGSLFDRRAERQALLREEARTALVDHLHRRLAHARSLSTLHVSRPRLVAAWPGER